MTKKYKLNPRFKAYIGICYYHEWDYRKACEYIEKAMPDLEIYAPHERNIYYNTIAESHFMLGGYEMAVPFYEMQLLVCNGNEKADIFYRLGLCHMFNGKWENASDCFNSALLYYNSFHIPDRVSRIAQTEKMIKECEEKGKNGNGN